MLVAFQIPRLHDLATAFWHDPEAAPPQPESGFDQLILDQHRANFDLWHREDEARDPLAGDSVIAQVKHDIDRLNQRRNDLVEQIDSILLEAAAPDPRGPQAPLHSETPGLIIDRLSILALKIFHTAAEVRRPNAPPEHHNRNRSRLSVLNEQRTDLASCLAELWSDVRGGRRRFKLYRQLKMYNDPSLNPILYGRTRPASS